MRKLVLAVACATLLAACAAPVARQSPDIPELSNTWETALNAGEIDDLVALYAEDARVMPPNDTLGEGHGVVREAFGAMIEAGLTGELETVEAMAAGDLGYHVGTYTIRAAGEVVDRGKFLEIWRRTADGWKISNDIWNSDLPAAGGGELVVATHEVKDPAHWLAAWREPEGRREDFRRHGATSVRVFQSPDDPKRVALLVEVDDLEALMAWVASDEGARAKAADGVVDPTVRILTEVE